MSTKACAHLQQVNQNINAKTPNGCEECLQMGSDWVHLRLCLSCGHVGCCDSSPNKQVPNTSNQLVTLLSNHSNQVKIGNGVMLRDL
jgi:hypothetical protein